MAIGPGGSAAARLDPATTSGTGSRDYPVLSLVGGKWTTFRAFGAEAAFTC
jgi:glycerol-3-phosphate dehydrogenase